MTNDSISYIPTPKPVHRHQKSQNGPQQKYHNGKSWNQQI